MKAGACAARIAFDDGDAPRSLDYGDRYHPRGGAFQQAREVFLAGNGLPLRWAHRQRFVILETGFGLGNNFLATWAAWRDDAARCEHLYFLSVDQHPPTAADLQRAHAGSPEPELAAQLWASWPAATHDLHLRHFAGGRVHLLLAFGDIATWLPQWLASVDAFFLDGFAPARNPAMWEPRVFTHMNRLAAAGATAATWSSARVVRDGLAAAHFDVRRCAGFDGKRDRLEALHAPHHRAAAPVGRRFGSDARSVAIVGAGLAGAAVANALSRQGLACTVFDAQAEAAQGGSGQAAGLLHGVVHADDSPHTRWYRIAALHTSSAIAPLIAAGRVQGRLDGLLRVERELPFEAMRARLRATGLPEGVVSATTREQATQHAGCNISAPAWWHRDGGWVDPRSLVRTWLDAGAVEQRLGTAIARLQRDAQGAWCLLDSAERALGRFDVVVLANAHDASRLAQSARAPDAKPLQWPLARSRGQVSLLSPALAADWRPAMPLAGAGYAITLPDGGLLCGATQQFDDNEASLRAEDHAHNLDALRTLSGLPWPIDPAAFGGRVAWRTHTRDRLPLVGRLPAAAEPVGPRGDQPRFIAREPGLFVLAALGSRGIAQSALGGEIVASMITGAPLPLGARLLDAIDAARFAARARRAALVKT